MPAHEPSWLRILCVLAALGATGLFLWSFNTYFVPAHPGVDQNGYLVGARQLALHGTMKQHPTLPGGAFDPHQFVGRMWIGADLGKPGERYYPKYPVGLPLIYALAFLAGGGQAGGGVTMVYWVNPIAMALAGVATFLIGKRLAGSIGGLIAMGLFLTAPVTLALTTSPNSHATAVCFVAWGMHFLLRWSSAGGKWTGLLAGLLLGYAVTIRYSEGTLLLPLALTALFVVVGARSRPAADSVEGDAPQERSRDLALEADRQPDANGWAGPSPSTPSGEPRSFRGTLVAFCFLAAGWLIPVVGLVIHNLATMGTVTGYDPTNESIGFSLQYAADNWETMLRQLSTTGLFFVLPFSVAGMIAMLWWKTRVAIVWMAWVVPCLVVYTFYYWAPDTSTVGYVRFFLTILPALTAAAAWTIRGAIDLAGATGRPLAAVAAIGAVLAIAMSAQLQQGLEFVEQDAVTRRTLAANAGRVLDVVPDGSAVFCTDNAIAHHLQFVRNLTLYTTETFQRPFVANLVNQLEMDEPQGLDPLRRAALWEKLGEMDQPALDAEHRRVVEAALDAGRRVFYIVPAREGLGLPRSIGDDSAKRAMPDWLRRRPKNFPFELSIVSTWNVPVVRPPLERGSPRARRLDFRPDRRTGHWFIIELTRKAPATQPTSQRSRPRA